MSVAENKNPPPVETSQLFWDGALHAFDEGQRNPLQLLVAVELGGTALPSPSVEIALPAAGPRDYLHRSNGQPVRLALDDLPEHLEREPNENPREGKRLSAGHLSLQGHDKETDVSFRNLRIADTGPETPGAPEPVRRLE